MKVTNYGFIVKGSDYIPTQHTAIIESDNFKTTIIGVSEKSEAFAVVEKMMKDGVQVVELCGGFELSDAEQIMKTTNNKLPVGVVQFGDFAKTLLDS